MFSFTIYIDANKSCGLDQYQKNQITWLIKALNDRRVNLHWITDCKKITVFRVLRIIIATHLLCKRSGVLIHNEIDIDGKRVSSFARRLLRLYPLSLVNQEQMDIDDLLCLKNNNKPEGCAFSSCLGNVVYVMSDGKNSLCPKMSRVRLNLMTKDGSITHIYDTPDFKSILLHQIQKRNRCKVGCSLYSLCLGGCPKQMDEKQCLFIRKMNNVLSSESSTNDQAIRYLSNLYRG